MPKMDKNAPKILAIFFHTMVQLANFWLVEEAQNPLFELAATLAWDNFHQLNAPVYCLLHDSVQLDFDLVALVVDVVQV